jgi:hypothetical protein
MAAEEAAFPTDGSEAGQRFRVESRHSTLSPWRKVRSFLVNLVSCAFAGPATWPPVDIVLVDLANSLVVRRWHEGGEQAAGLLGLLSDDLTTMRPDEFIDTWGVPVE